MFFLTILSYTKSLSDYFQHEDLDFVSAIRMQESLLTILKEKRCEKFFDEYYIQAQGKSQRLGFDDQELPMPKRRKVSQRLDDTPATQHHHLSAKSKYCIDFYYGTIDLMINTLEKRFSTESIRLLKGISGLHPSRLNESETLPKIEALAQFNENDVDAVALRGEFEMF